MKDTNILLTYNAQNAESARKAFEAIRIINESSLSELTNIDIVQDNIGAWVENQNKRITIIQPWELGAVMVRGRQCLYNDVVYIVIIGHTVDNINLTPDTVPTLYRQAPFVEYGQIYPSWGSIGLLDSENNWKLGEQVYHNLKEWESMIDDNIYEPGVVGSDIWKDLSIPEDSEEDYSNVVQWSPTDLWSTYTIGDLRKWNNAVYECKNPTYAQNYEPDSVAGLQYAWTFIEAIN